MHHAPRTTRHAPCTMHLAMPVQCHHASHHSLWSAPYNALCTVRNAPCHAPCPALAAQVSLPLHSDQSEYSLTLPLNDQADFEGGGTYFAGLGRALNCCAGGIVSFPGRLTHGAAPITAGLRYVIVAFLYEHMEETEEAEAAARVGGSGADPESHAHAHAHAHGESCEHALREPGHEHGHGHGHGH